MTDSEIPRRSRIDKYVPAETAISNAIEAVEEMPPDTRLTEAVILLGQAQDKVADFVDGVPVKTFPWYRRWQWTYPMVMIAAVALLGFVMSKCR